MPNEKTSESAPSESSPASGQTKAVKNSLEATATKDAVTSKPDMAGKSITEIYRLMREKNESGKSDAKETSTETEEELEPEAMEEKPEVEATAEENSNEADVETESETPEAKSEADGDESDKAGRADDDLKGAPRKALKRINKLTAEKYELQRKLDELSKGKPADESTPKFTSSEYDSPEAVNAAAEKIRDAINEIDALVIRKPKVDDTSGEEYWESGGQKLTRDQLSELKLNLNRKLTKELPTAYRQLTQETTLRTETQKELTKQFSWYKDDTSDLKRKFLEYKNHPRYKEVFNKFGEAELLFAGYLENEQRKLATNLSQSKVAKKTEKAPTPPLPTSAPAGETNTGEHAKVRSQYEALKKAAAQEQNPLGPNSRKLMEFKTKHRL